MASHTQGIGLFTAENIAAMLQAIPDSNGTYADTAGQGARTRRHPEPLHDI